MTPTARRLPAVAAALALAASLTACGEDGVLRDGSVAATYGSTTVSTDQVQRALADLQAFAPDAQITGARTAVVLALAPTINRMAARHGVSMSQDEARRAFAEGRTGRTPSAEALTALATESEVSRLVNGKAAGQQEVNRVLDRADIELNPRYGQWRKGGAYGPAPADWIVPSAPASPAS